MLKQVKKMFNNEKYVREIGRYVDECVIDCIVAGESEDERAHFANMLKKDLADNAKHEEESSECWYKIGYHEGLNVGIIIGGTAALLGLVMGNKIKR